jgi:hypothetical protein
MQMGHELRENTNSSLSEEEKSGLEEDKEVNRVTAYNSTAFSRNAEQEDQRSTMNLSHNKELKLLSVITENSKNNTQPQRRKTNGIYPL